MEDYSGKICPVCQREIRNFEKVKICTECGIPHHLKCWEENGGCSTFGCDQQGTYKNPVSTTAQDNKNIGIITVNNGQQANAYQHNDYEPVFFGKIGKKIKTFAQIMFWIQAVACIIAGFYIEAKIRPKWENVFGWLLIIVGPIITWISMWFLYGFGELIDKVSDIEKNTRGGISVSVTQSGNK